MFEDIDIKFKNPPIPTVGREETDIEDDIEDAIGWLIKKAETEWKYWSEPRDRYYFDEKI